MKQIRQSVFETNSSSTHSICIAMNPKGVYSTITPDAEGNVVLDGGEFGWEVETYTDPITKANYCAVDNLEDEDKLEMLKTVIKEQTGCNEVIILAQCDEYNKPYYSYIDHQSSGTSYDAFESSEILKEFIFGEKSMLITDNDNH